MEKKIDTRFLLNCFLNENIQNDLEFQTIKAVIKKDGYSIIKTRTESVKVYRPELWFLFASNSFFAFNIETQTEELVRTFDYFLTYIDGYKEGEMYFETEFKVSANTLYGANAEQYVRDIHFNFFHKQHTLTSEGWGYVKKSNPSILTHKVIREFGFYSGIVNKVEEQVQKHPQLFATFDKCDHKPPIQQTQTEQLKVKQIALIHFYEGKQITRENAGKIAAEHGYNSKSSGEGLFQDYTNYSSTANRKGKPTLCTPKKLQNKIDLFESVLNFLSDSNKQRAIDEIRILKTLFENEYP
jgi:hypothetical protein